jgi:N-acetylglucosaminyl-diphospho-decaprenol L-rhamnosyltransferase
MTRTSVVVVAFRSADHLERGLPPVMADPDVGDIVVVDNSSDPRTAEVVGRTGGRVRYIDPGENLGFARGCNLGYRSTGDPVVTFLNPDVLLERGLGELVKACLTDGSMVAGGGLAGGAEAGVLLNARRPATLRNELGRAVLGARASQDRRPFGTATTPVAQVDGALLMASRAFLDELDGFDERFELYFEDVDLCSRARERGHVVMDTRRYGTHAGGASSRTVAAASYWVFRVSRVRYFAKRAGVPGAAAAVLISALELVVRTVTRQPEGWSVRRRALLLAGRELLRPGTVRVLSGGG